MGSSGGACSVCATQATRVTQSTGTTSTTQSTRSTCTAQSTRPRLAHHRHGRAKKRHHCGKDLFDEVHEPTQQATQHAAAVRALLRCVARLLRIAGVVCGRVQSMFGVQIG